VSAFPTRLHPAQLPWMCRLMEKA